MALSYHFLVVATMAFQRHSSPDIPDGKISQILSGTTGYLGQQVKF